jgi:hypothetical protein
MSKACPSVRVASPVICMNRSMDAMATLQCQPVQSRFRTARRVDASRCSGNLCCGCRVCVPMRRGRAAAQFAKTAALGHARCKPFIDQTACWQKSFVHLVRLRRALKLLGQPDIMPTIEPVSGRSPFPGKSDFGVQRQNGHNVRRGRVRESRDQVCRAKGANTRVFGAAPENLRGAATDWWSNEDSNQGPA